MAVPAVPWEIVIMQPWVLATLFFTCILFLWLMMLLTRTPAMTFLLAGFGRNVILINPDEDKRMSFRIAKKDGGLAHVKKKGYYILKPKDIHVEPKSKLPMAIVYGMYSESIDVNDANIAEKLKEAGVENYVQLLNKVYEDIDAKEAFRRGEITKEQFEQYPEKRYKVKKKNVDGIKLGGQSLGFDRIVNYFAKNTRADLVESFVQHRESAMKLQKIGESGAIFKWAIILVIVMIGAALAYSMISMNKANAPQAVKQVGGAVGGLTNIVNGTGLI